MWVIIGIAAAILFYIMYTYNSFASLRNRARNAWADIDVQLKRRHDLIPNLVATVQGYASHEKSVFEDVARLRAKAIQSGNVNDVAGNESDLSSAIKSIFAVAESYPELKADASFRDLQTQLSETENNIQYARRYYNAVVRDMNTKTEMFPSGIIGSWFGFGRMEYFQVADEERENVQIDLEDHKQQ